MFQDRSTLAARDLSASTKAVREAAKQYCDVIAPDGPWQAQRMGELLAPAAFTCESPFNSVTEAEVLAVLPKLTETVRDLVFAVSPSQVMYGFAVGQAEVIMDRAHRSGMSFESDGVTIEDADKPVEPVKTAFRSSLKGLANRKAAIRTQLPLTYARACIGVGSFVTGLLNAAGKATLQGTTGVTVDNELDVYSVFMQTALQPFDLVEAVNLASLEFFNVCQTAESGPVSCPVDVVMRTTPVTQGVKSGSILETVVAPAEDDCLKIKVPSETEQEASDPVGTFTLPGVDSPATYALALFVFETYNVFWRQAVLVTFWIREEGWNPAALSAAEAEELAERLQRWDPYEVAEARAATLKESGNAAFVRGDIEESVIAYSQAFSMCPAVSTLPCVVLTNRAVARQHVQWATVAELENSIEDCTHALAYDPLYWKAYYRRAAAAAEIVRLVQHEGKTLSRGHSCRSLLTNSLIDWLCVLHFSPPVTGEDVFVQVYQIPHEYPAFDPVWDEDLALSASACAFVMEHDPHAAINLEKVNLQEFDAGIPLEFSMMTSDLLEGRHPLIMTLVAQLSDMIGRNCTRPTRPKAPLLVPDHEADQQLERALELVEDAAARGAKAPSLQSGSATGGSAAAAAANKAGAARRGDPPAKAPSSPATGQKTAATKKSEAAAEAERERLALLAELEEEEKKKKAKAGGKADPAKAKKKEEEKKKKEELERKKREAAAEERRKKEEEEKRKEEQRQKQREKDLAEAQRRREEEKRKKEELERAKREAAEERRRKKEAEEQAAAEAAAAAERAQREEEEKEKAAQTKKPKSSGGGKPAAPVAAPEVESDADSEDSEAAESRMLQEAAAKLEAEARRLREEAAARRKAKTEAAKSPAVRDAPAPMPASPPSDASPQHDDESDSDDDDGAAKGDEPAMTRREKRLLRQQQRQKEHAAALVAANNANGAAQQPQQPLAALPAPKSETAKPSTPTAPMPKSQQQQQQQAEDAKKKGGDASKQQQQPQQPAPGKSPVEDTGASAPKPGVPLPRSQRTTAQPEEKSANAATANAAPPKKPSPASDVKPAPAVALPTPAPAQAPSTKQQPKKSQTPAVPAPASAKQQAPSQPQQQQTPAVPVPASKQQQQQQQQQTAAVPAPASVKQQKQSPAMPAPASSAKQQQQKQQQQQQQQPSKEDDKSGGNGGGWAKLFRGGEEGGAAAAGGPLAKSPSQPVVADKGGKSAAKEPQPVAQNLPAPRGKTSSPEPTSPLTAAQPQPQGGSRLPQPRSAAKQPATSTTASAPVDPAIVDSAIVAATTATVGEPKSSKPKHVPPQPLATTPVAAPKPAAKPPPAVGEFDTFEVSAPKPAAPAPVGFTVEAPPTAPPVREHSPGTMWSSPGGTSTAATVGSDFMWGPPVPAGPSAADAGGGVFGSRQPSMGPPSGSQGAPVTPLLNLAPQPAGPSGGAQADLPAGLFDFRALSGAPGAAPNRDDSNNNPATDTAKMFEGTGFFS